MMRKNYPFNYKKAAHEILNQWMLENNLTGTYVIHHRDDTEECRQYNAKNAHYKMWGFDADGTFTLGKWVVFISRSEHVSHHHKGKYVSESTREKISTLQKGRTLSDEHKKHISENAKPPWAGKKLSDEHRAKLSESHKGHLQTDETKMRRRNTLAAYSEAFNEYKASGGTMKWQQFISAFKNAHTAHQDDAYEDFNTLKR